MAQQPTWDQPEVREAVNAGAREDIQELLQSEGLTHLKVLTRGRHVVIYSEEMDEKVPRVRFTRIGHGRYELDMANHRGAWEPSPFTGTLAELFAIVSQQFAWVLTDIKSTLSGLLLWRHRARERTCRTQY